MLAAEGAITFIEKLSPALEQVDSSSGALGTAVNRAIETLVPVIAKAEIEARVRQRWLERLWEAIQNDEMPYLETLGDLWGELCVTPELASAWADAFVPTVERVWSAHDASHGYFKGTTACLASLYAAGRHDELLALLEKARFKWWHDRRWGVKALAAQGKKAEPHRHHPDSDQTSRSAQDSDSTRWRGFATPPLGHRTNTAPTRARPGTSLARHAGIG